MDNLEEVLKEPLKVSSDKLYVNADVDINITKAEQLELDLSEQMQLNLDEPDTKEVEAPREEPSSEMTKAEYAVKCKKEAMVKLGEYEVLENKKVALTGDLTKAQQELESLFAKVRAQNLDLINKINSLTDELEVTQKSQELVREELLPIQRELYLADNKEKTLVYNKIQSTFVAATEKNKFDLKKFREEQAEFWKSNYNLLKDYAEITDVSAYLKITIKK